MSYYIDAHCHLHEPWFNKDSIPTIVEQAAKFNVKKIITCASDPDSFLFVLDNLIPNRLYASLGIQPTLADKITNVSSLVAHLEDRISRSRIKAIGEVGLDYYWVKDEKLRKKQKKLFILAIKLANEYDLPLVIHSRKAEKESLDILEKESQVPILLHSFEGNLQLMERAKDLGYLISIPTNVVIRKSRRKVAKRAGLNNIVIETDSPYCAPSDDIFPNTPQNIQIAAVKIASILDLDIMDVMNSTTSNANKFYRL